MHILNVSFLVPTLRREFGGCAGNIAYNLAQLGGHPVVLAALGPDGSAYRDRIASWGADVSHIRTEADSYTAQAIIITDGDNNQITAFHPGAMQSAHLTPIPRDPRIRIAIVAPDGRDAMIQHAAQLHAARIPFIFDPGQGLPMFDATELLTFVEQATWLAVNDYEARMLSERTGSSIEQLSRTHLQGIVVTLGADGCEVWRDGNRTHVKGKAADMVVDPTGCGDAFRAALLLGLEKGWELEACAQLGNEIGAIKVSHRGGQNHHLAKVSA